MTSEHPRLAAEILAGKHAIGNHTYDHPSLVFLSRQRINDELNRCEDAVFRATGERTVCVRPPFGFRGPQFRSAARQAGFSKVVMWSINGRDWKPEPARNVTVISAEPPRLVSGPTFDASTLPEPQREQFHRNLRAVELVLAGAT